MRAWVLVFGVLFSPLGLALSFQNACAPAEKTLILGGVGDFLMHGALQNSGNAQGYAALWKGVQYRINQVDMMYGNLETPIAPGLKYSSYPMFNAPPALLTAIKMSGFDVVSTANNHAMDRRKTGIEMTIDQLNAHGLLFTGTRKSGESKPFATIVERNGFKLGFVSCTYALNGFKDPGSQILECYEDESSLMKEIKDLRDQVDAVIVTPHWGIEYRHTPEPREIQLAKRLIEVGATAVLATHPHVIQPIEKYVSKDGREGFIAYSSGNFISGQTGIKKLGLMLFLGLSKSGTKTWINGVRYAPIYMVSPSSGVYFLDNTKAQKSLIPKVHQVIRDDHGYLSSQAPLVTNPECR